MEQQNVSARLSQGQRRPTLFTVKRKGALGNGQLLLAYIIYGLRICFIVAVLLTISVS